MIDARGGLKPTGILSLFINEYVEPSEGRFDNYIATVYGREGRFGNYIVLQYWFFYPYNLQEAYFLAAGEDEGGAGILLSAHEGGLEMIQIMIDVPTKQPLSATYSVHWGGKTFDWSEIEKIDGHPIVYVAKGGHASGS